MEIGKELPKKERTRGAKPCLILHPSLSQQLFFFLSSFLSSSKILISSMSETKGNDKDKETEEERESNHQTQRQQSDELDLQTATKSASSVFSVTQLLNDDQPSTSTSASTSTSREIRSLPLRSPGATCTQSQSIPSTSIPQTPIPPTPSSTTSKKSKASTSSAAKGKPTTQQNSQSEGTISYQYAAVKQQFENRDFM